MRHLPSATGLEWKNVLLSGITVFAVYTCAMGLRKPVTSATFEGLSFLAIDYKIWIVLAQTAGYTLAKFYGIRFIGELTRERRERVLIQLISLALFALLLFALVPPPYNLLFFVVNGFPLGVIYGVMLSYLEGRRTTELLGAMLATSFIFAAGFTQSVGKYILSDWGVGHWWMPFTTGAVFFVPMVFGIALLRRIPQPSESDILERTERVPMDASSRRHFIRSFLPGLVLLITIYMLFTTLRDYRSNFAANIWEELGFGDQAAIYTASEIPASVFVLIVMSLLVLFRDNLTAFLVNHLLILLGCVTCIASTWAYTAGSVSPFWWITLTGMGLYMVYVPFNCMLFERLIATFRYGGNAAFIVYLADSIAYIGSDAVLLFRNFAHVEISWSAFYIQMVYVVSVTGIVLTLLSAAYFYKKHQQKLLSDG
jgi:MFS family permease